MCIPFSTWVGIILVHPGAIWDLSPFRLALYGLYLWKLGLQWTQKLVMCPARPFILGSWSFWPILIPIKHHKTIWRIASIGTTTSILWRIFHQVLFFRAASTGAGTLSPNSFRSSFCSPTVCPCYHPMVFPIWSLLNHKKNQASWSIWKFPGLGHPQIIHGFLFAFLLNKPSILGYPHFCSETSVSGGYPLVNVYSSLLKMAPVEKVDLPIKNGGSFQSFHSFLHVYQRVTSPIMNPIILNTPNIWSL